MRAAPRRAVLSHVRNSSGFNALVAHITKGPKTELHRELHVMLTPADLPALRNIVAALERKAAERNNQGS